MNKNKIIIPIICFFFLTSYSRSQDNFRFIRDFDSVQKNDRKMGYVTYAKGVIGDAINLDGLSSYI